ncbi:FG-GAP-like repeat-containing protein [Pendulispora brunnea]|uniref:FG-GAP-like repeat-containing protein n=1 Tax=Pendulispora brunnea TaxID=2905690 RepID=A0ABZ2KD98_9BACT
MTVTIDPPSVPADATSVATVTVKFRNPENGQPWKGQQVILTSSGKGTRIVIPNSVTNDDGVVTATISSTFVEKKTIKAQVGDYYNSADINFSGCTSALFAPLAPVALNAKVGALIASDFNRDGNADVVFTDDLRHPSVWLGNGDGTFRNVPGDALDTRVSSFNTGDVNNDGKVDIVVTTNESGSAGVSILLGKGDGTFERGATFSTGNAFCKSAPQDYSGDGKLDLVVSDETGNLSVLLGNGDGTFQSGINTAISQSPNGVLSGDYNGDGKRDIGLYTQRDHTMSILLGNGSGAFQKAFGYDLGEAPYPSTVGDFNGDGKSDLAVGFYDNNLKVLLATGNGALSSAVPYSVGTGPVPTTGDLDGDGKPDLLTANSEETSISLLIGNGDGTFQSQIPYGNLIGPSNPNVGDFNGDGKIDFAVTNYPGALNVFLRTGCSR